jgi:type IV pilus assembly protein PilA
MKNKSGFTIVELLIVIVVIAILAAISIVAYNGIQTRAKTSSAQASINSVVKKAQLFYSDKGYYPTSVADLTTNAASADVFKLSGVTFTSLSAIRASPAPSSDSINYQVCAPGSPANLTAITPSNVSGALVYYRDYGLSGTGSEVGTAIGVTNGIGMACFTSS